MISIFSKKQFLSDFLSGCTDIHCHILPGIDDGPDSVKKAIQLLKGFAEIGVTDFIATPHVMSDLYPNSETSILKSRFLLADALADEQYISPRIKASAEYMIDNNFEELTSQKRLMPLKDYFVLVEMSYVQPPIYLESALEILKENGYIPVLAHPERYQFYHNRYGIYEKLKNLGCVFQMNALSIGGFYGSGVQQTALRLLEDRYIDFIGTDIHHLAHLEELKNLQISRKMVNSLLPVINRTKNVFMNS